MKSIFPRLIAIAALYLAGIPAAQAQTPAGADRPATVPAGYVVTPFGYFHASCVRHLAEGDVLQSDERTIRHADGTAVQTPACAYPHYGANGMAVSAGARVLQNPKITGWIESASSEVSNAFSALSVEWSVPNTPSTNDGQTLYYFPGLENSVNAPIILQPVLGWNADFTGAWGIASWNCCHKGAVYESVVHQVSPGDTIYGAMTCAVKGNPCRSWNIVTTDMQNGLSSRMAQAPAFNQTFNWALGGVLEVYNVKQCTDFPSNGSISFNDIRLVDNLGRLVAQPEWVINSASR